MVDSSSSEQNLILSLDQGGHSSRAIVYNQLGDIVAMAKYSLNVDRPENNWVQQDGPDIVTSMREVIKDVYSQLGPQASLVRTAGLATQRSNTMCWDIDTGKALSKAISWQDTRSYADLNEYKPYADLIRQRTGLHVTAHYGATKLRWCLDNLPEVQAAIKQNRLAWGPLASYLIYSLTSEQMHLIDPANASRTLLWSLDALDWDQDLMSCFRVPRRPLPRCVSSKYGYGHISEANPQVALTSVTGDQSAAMFAFGKPRSKTLYINIGTGAFLQYSTGSERIHITDLLSGIIYHDGITPQYCIECTVNGAGSALSLVEEQIGMDKAYAEKNFDEWLDREDVQIPLFLNGVSGLGTPYWISDFNSRFVGDGQDWQKIVAVAESILFLIVQNIARLHMAKLAIEQIWITGGLSVSNQLCQKLSDLSGHTIYRPTVSEATARGTAWLASNTDNDWHDDAAGLRFAPRNNNTLNLRFEAWQREMAVAIRDHIVR